MGLAHMHVFLPLFPNACPPSHSSHAVSDIQEIRFSHVLASSGLLQNKTRVPSLLGMLVFCMTPHRQPPCHMMCPCPPLPPAERGVKQGCVWEKERAFF